MSHYATVVYLVFFISGSGHLYEDDGVTEAYKSTDFTNTSFSYKHDTSKYVVTLLILIFFNFWHVLYISQLLLQTITKNCYCSILICNFGNSLLNYVLHFIYFSSLAMNLLLTWMQQLVVTLTFHQKEAIKLLYQTSGLVILNNSHIHYTCS